MKFNIQKYKQWLQDRQKIDHLTVDTLLYLNGMQELDGMDWDLLWKQGHLILKEWCDEDDIDTEIKIRYIKDGYAEAMSLDEFRSYYLARKRINELSKKV